ncbi:MAG: beta-ketoacyl synthase N-terminal-like domain-containing protein [Pelolinea sp.]|nr:beta-ketoacyl synthase N-terminal-like domain-containing protein [Pelolinea sp.]
MKKNKTLTQNTTRASDPMTPIAIVGMASIMPEAENLDQYWDNIVNEVNCIREVPQSRWNVDEYFDPDPSAPDKSYSKYGGFIPDIDFDPIEFGLPPNILEVTDVSQLLSLVVARDALTDAGYMNANETLLDRTGVILGMVGMSSNVIQPLLSRLQYPVWEKVLRSSGISEGDIQKIVEKMKLAYISWNENAFPGAIGNVIAGRIANRFNLGGTNCVIDAACASSLAAIKMAVSELIEGHADMMITGGVDTDNSILAYMCFSKTPAFSKGDRSKAFDSQSDGMLAGEGIGMLILKRLEDAEADHDRIYAVIKGIGSSSDGRSKSIYAPSSGGQAKALRRAYERANFSPSSIGLIEAHGTGTNAGDSAEFEGLQEVFGEQGFTKQHIALGSIKSQIGHTKATAGAAGLIKSSLALYHKIQPATINVSQPNLDFNIKESPFFINTETRPWFKNKKTPARRAGISAFGFGGTNFHVALEEYTQDQDTHSRLQSTPYTILLSAQTNELLIKDCQESLGKLESTVGNIYLNQLDQEAGDSTIPDDHARIGFVTETLADACEKMQTCIKLIADNNGQDIWSHPQGIFYRKTGVDPKGKTVALFPGQGAQYVNMGKDLVMNFPLLRQTFEKANEIISSDERIPLTDHIYPIPVFTDAERNDQKELLTRTENAQPAIGTLSVGLYKLLANAGFEADFFAGHSFGELTALWASGVFDEDTLIRLAKARGEAMAVPASSDKDTGTMIAVKGDIELIQDLLKGNHDVTIANFNSTTQVVVAGSTQAVQTIKPELEKLGLTVFPLQVSAAFHTPFVEHAQAPFKLAIEKETFQEPIGGVYSNSTAHEYEKDPRKISQMLTDHILNPVLFKEEIENIYENGGSIFVEIGPKNILTNLVKDILKNKPHETITLNENTKGNSDLQYRQAILQMRVLGFKLGISDPHKDHQVHTQPAHSKVAVKLNGGLYITQKTRSKFDEALQEKHFVTTNTNTAQRASEQPSTNHKSSSDQTSQDTSINLTVNAGPASSSVSEELNMGDHHIQSFVEQLQEHQSDILKVHKQFLQNDTASKNILGEITQTEISIISKINNGQQQKDADQSLLVLEKRAEFVNAQHAGTSNAHLEYIKSQTAFSQQYTALLKELINSNQTGTRSLLHQIDIQNEGQRLNASVPAVEAPMDEITPSQKDTHSLQTNQSAAPSYDVDQLTQSFLQIVSDKTGYPTEMLELGMDMEADLGIDSIKRVEILGAIQEQYPQLPTIAAEDLAVLRTLAQIIAAFNAVPTSIKTGTTVAIPADSVEAKAASYVGEDIQSAFMEIVSEKTGYPTDMLELGMDMEADLGIDSIKRVEILGAIQEQYPHLPTIAAEDLAVLRTLEQIISAFNSPPNNIKQNEPEQKGSNPTPISASVEKEQTESFVAPDIQPAFMEIVSEKTGYPTDMLDLGMDMEADLGIDSIKRVEFLGAMQERFPHLPIIEAEDLAILRTLEQIITKFATEGNGSDAAQPNALTSVDEEITPPDQPVIERFPVEVKQIAQPDYLEFEIPKDNLILITDDGAEKSQLLAKSFSASGHKVGMIHLGKINSDGIINSENGVLHFYFNELKEDMIQSKMEEIIGDHNKISAFIHINPSAHNDQQDLLQVSENQAAVLKTVFLMARHLKKPMIAASEDSRSAFLTITQVDGQFGLNGNSSHDPTPGGFSGLAKTLRLEWNNVFCRALDLHPNIDSETAVKIINNELHDPNLLLAEVGYTQDGRYTISLGEKEMIEE